MSMIDQIILDAQRIANRVKDLEALGNALLIEAEANNRQIETMKQFQDDIESLNKLARNKTNAEMVNRINQQNPSISEIRQENRELKASLEDHQRALEMIMHKYREHTQHNILSSRINFKELCNAKNSKMSDVIRKQAEKITEMAAVMQQAAAADDDNINKDIECINRLRIENEGLRELLQISNQFGSTGIRIGYEDKSVQTEECLFNKNQLDNLDKSTITATTQSGGVVVATAATTTTNAQIVVPAAPAPAATSTTPKISTPIKIVATAVPATQATAASTAAPSIIATTAAATTATTTTTTATSTEISTATTIVNVDTIKRKPRDASSMVYVNGEAGGNTSVIDNKNSS